MYYLSHNQQIFQQWCWLWWWYHIPPPLLKIGFVSGSLMLQLVVVAGIRSITLMWKNIQPGRIFRITKRVKTSSEQTCWQHFFVLHSVCSNWKAASDVPSPSPASGCLVKMTMAEQHIPTSQNTKNKMMMTMIMIVHSFFPLHAGGHSRSLGLVHFNRRRKNIFVRHVRPDNVLRMGCTIYLGTDLWFIWKRPSGFKYKSIEDKENSQRHLKILTSAWSF